ncbi:hypothetical protein ACOZ4N_00945 (plasmid) [Halorientalis pallida]|uniref:hypothetical protein n=1 Tax=Halorientalis pallida TaxID=2479928 RepID=UPI003C6FB0E5
MTVVLVVGGIKKALGAIPDAISWAIGQLIRSASGDVIGQLVDYGFGPLLEISNPNGNADALAAWSQITDIAIMLLPILVAARLIAMPFSDDEEGSLWVLVLNGVAVIFFIAISKPLWGFAIDATNAVTMALLPNSFKVQFANNALNGWGTAGSILIYPLVAVLMFFSLMISAILLLIRWFLVWTAFIGSSLFAVAWYLNSGRLESVGKFGSAFLRMGLIALISGPVIAIVLRVASVIMGGGVITTGGHTGLELAVSLGMVAILPILIFLVCYKMVAQAGSSLGVGSAMTMVIAATAAALGAGAVAGGGAAAGGGAGGSAGGAGGASAGGAGGSAGGSSSAGAVGKGVATDPSAATDGTTIGSGLRKSIGDSLSTNRSASGAEQNVPSLRKRTREAAGNAGKKVGSAGKQVGAGLKDKAPAPLGGRGAEAVGKVPGKAKETARSAVGSNLIDGFRAKETDLSQKAVKYQENAGMLHMAQEDGEIDVHEAAERGLIESSDGPAPNETTVPVNEAGTMSDGRPAYTAEYEGADGEQKSFNLTEAHDEQLEAANKAGGKADDAAKAASAISDVQSGTKSAAVKTGKSAGGFVGKSAKIGTAAMVGGVTQSPYLGYHVGKSVGSVGSGSTTGSPNMLIGAHTENAAKSSDTTQEGAGESRKS